MTRDDITRLAREAGGDDWGIFRDFMPEIERFAALVAASEREACARVAESYEPECDTCPSGVSNAIRARGQTKPETVSPAEHRRRTNAPWNDKASY